MPPANGDGTTAWNSLSYGGFTGPTGTQGPIAPTTSGTGYALVYNATASDYYYNSTITVSGVSTITVDGNILPTSSNNSLGSSTNPWGAAYLTQTSESVYPLTSASGTVTHDWNDGSVFYHTGITANFTANITNVPTTNNRSYVIVLNLDQGLTPYYANVLHVNGSPVTIKWLNAAAPSPTANRLEMESFTIYRVSNIWVATGQYASFG